MDQPTSTAATRRASPFSVAMQLASAQSGCVGRAQLLRAGLSAREIAGLLARGELARIVPGVYALGIAVLTREAAWWAASLFGGEGSRLGRRSALEAHGALPIDLRTVTVTVPRRGGGGVTSVPTRLRTATGRVARIEVVRAARVSQPVRVDAGLWADPPLRAIDDLAVAGKEGELRKAWREADYLGKLSEPVVLDYLRGAPRGAGMIRTLRAEIPLVGADHTLLSRAERWLLEHLVSAGLPAPKVNQLVDFEGRMFRPDFWFVLAKLIVEVDGPQHKKPARMREDEARDAHLHGLGIEVLRFDDVDVWADVRACLDIVVRRLDERTPRQPS